MGMRDAMVRESEYVVAWFLFWLCATVAGLILGALAGALVGALLGALGVDMAAIRVVCGLAGFLVSIPLSYLSFRFVVGRMIVKKIEARVDEADGIT